MAQYQRFLSYLFEYEGDQKKGKLRVCKDRNQRRCTAYFPVCKK